MEKALEKKDYREVWGGFQASQGVLLLNTALTVERGKPGSHLNIWKPFTKDLIKKLITETTDIVWLLWGRPAQQLYDECWIECMSYFDEINNSLNFDYEEGMSHKRNSGIKATTGYYINPEYSSVEDGNNLVKQKHTHISIKTSHPSPFSANKQLSDCPSFIGSNCFSNCNKILSELGKKGIKWNI